jgi:cytochrome P450
MTQTQLPPGPSGRFVAPLRFIDYCRDPLAYMTRMARQYGDVVLLPGFGMPVYMFNHPDQIEEILRHKHRVFKKDFYMEALRPLLGNGLLSSEGEEWRRARAMAQPAFQARQIQQYAATMVAHTERMIASWKPGETRNVHIEMMRLTSQIVTKTLFDVEVDDEEGSIGKTLEAAMLFYANPLSMWPKWRHVPTPTNLRFRRTLGALDALMFKMIRERRTAGPSDRSDLLSRLLCAEDEQGRKMSDTELRDELLTLFLAGHETTALTLSYTFYLLATHTDVEAELHAELDRVLADRPPSVGDVPALHFAENVIKESMRMYPPAWTLGREATEDVEIGGYPIKKGAQVLMAQWVVHRDSRFWPEPERFRPSRWDEEQTKQLPRCAYFPFGDGPRVCIGNNFAMMEAVLLLTAIARRFRLELVPGQTLRLVPSVTMRPRDGIRVFVRNRGDAQSVVPRDRRASANVQYATN